MSKMYALRKVRSDGTNEYWCGRFGYWGKATESFTDDPNDARTAGTLRTVKSNRTRLINSLFDQYKNYSKDELEAVQDKQIELDNDLKIVELKVVEVGEVK